MNRRDIILKQQARLLAGIGVPQNYHFEIDDFQREAIESVTAGHDTLVVAPTGAGKTYIAIESIRSNLELNCRSVYTTPLKALSNTKYNEFRRIFEPKFRVGLLTGDRKIEREAHVVIATTEIYRNELYQAPERYALIVLDEVHFISDPQRGPVWEESIILTPTTATLLMLSASISNYTEVSEWIEHVRGRPCRVVIKEKRPVELRYGFLHPDYGPLPLSDEHGRLLREVEHYYGSVSLDRSGMRLQGGRFAREGQDRGQRPRRRRRHAR